MTPGSASHTFWGAGGRQKRFGELAFIVPTFLTCKKTPEGAGTHTGHTSAHADTRITQTNLTTIQTQRQSTHPHEHHATAEMRGRLNSRKNSRRPGADRSPRPTQKRPPPANPTLPPPAPRAPPRACSKAVGDTAK